MNRARNSRRRTADDDEEGAGDSLVIKPLPPKNSKPKTTTKPLPPGRSKLLSFADDEDDTSTLGSRNKSGERLEKTKSQSSRSLLSFHDGDAPNSTGHAAARKTTSSLHKIVSSKDRTAQSSVPSNVQPQAGEYTKEKLLELQKNTRTLGAAKPSLPPEAEPVIVLKGLVKPPVTPKSMQTHGPEDIDVETKTEGGEKKLGEVRSDSERDPSIPDEAMIAAIRAKREWIRQAKLAPDYTSLEGGSLRGISGDEGAGSSDDEIDFPGRIALLSEKKGDPVRKGVFEAIEAKNVESGSGMEIGVEEVAADEDEEEKRWEEEQFRKGFGKRVDDVSNRVSGTPAPVPGSVFQAGQPHSAYPLAGSIAGRIVGITRSAEVMSINQKAEVANRALEQNFQMLQDTYDRTISSFNRTDENLTTSSLNAADLEKSLSVAGVI